MYNGFTSGLFYAEHGIASYPYAYETNPVTMWKFELKEILKHQKPKVLVVETNGACYGVCISWKEPILRSSAESAQGNDHNKNQEQRDNLFHV